MKVIGTAGHIDHGKSTLVHRLTGIDPDRLEEEKRRGMTIDLGFAWLTLPSGTDVSIVDVPGHERFVANMLAGAAGIDVGLLVVAADESVMPQTREHLDILQLLGIRQGVVALTKRDLVDDELIELVSEEVGELLAATPLAGAPVIPVSAVTGDGVSHLLSALDAAVAAVPERRDVTLPYLPVDRVFTVSGFGTVVTGTLHDGSLAPGQEVEVLPSGGRARIRSLQTHRRQVAVAEPGARVAVNLSGIERSAIARGDVLAPPGTVIPTHRFDAHISVVSDAPFPLRHGSQVMLHIGAAQQPATVALLEEEELEPGATGWVQVRIDDAVVAVPDERFILRLPAPARTIAGGRVVDSAPRHRLRSAEALGRLADLSSLEPLVRAEAAVRGARPMAARDLALSLRLRRGVLDDALLALAASGRSVRLGELYWHRDDWDAFVKRAEGALQAYHSEHPLKRGMPKESLRTRLRRTPAEWHALLTELARSGRFREEDSLIALATHRGGSAVRAEEAERLLQTLRAAGNGPTRPDEALKQAGASVEVLEALVEEGKIVRVGTDALVTREELERLVRETLAVIDQDGRVTAAGLRDALGVSRKFAVALLEHLDSQRVTRRVGDDRVRGSRAFACV